MDHSGRLSVVDKEFARWACHNFAGIGTEVNLSETF
jgi:hypothetical protein